MKTAFFIFGSFAFSFNIGNTIHEFGHVLADWSSGIPIKDIRILIHPFFAPHLIIQNDLMTNLMGFPDAAGPLANVLLGLTVFTLAWKQRNSYLVPFLFWGPLALVQEGFGLIVTMSQAGSDSARIIEAGFPPPILISFCVISIIVGILLFLLVIPLTGVRYDTPWYKYTGVLLLGMLPYGVITLIVNTFSNQPQANFSRGINVTAGFALIALLISGSHMFCRAIRNHKYFYKETQIRWGAPLFSVGLLVVISLVELVFWNG